VFRLVRPRVYIIRLSDIFWNAGASGILRKPRRSLRRHEVRLATRG
jgi:hypothetical protein